MTQNLQAPFPYFGGKSKVASEIWNRFGEVRAYAEPFAGSLAVLLASPYDVPNQSVNDLDGLLVNVWRAIKHDPEGVAALAEVPRGSLEMAARNNWLYARNERINDLIKDPDYYDVRAAAYWMYVKSSLIGGRGLAQENIGIRLTNAVSQGIHAQKRRGRLVEIFCNLSERLRHVQIECADWSNFLSGTLLSRTPVAIFFDPPYQKGEWDGDVYEHSRERNVFEEVRQWCLEHGDNPNFRIALCGYEGVEMPESWSTYAWKAHGGYAHIGKEDEGRGKLNAKRERIWFSPHCQNPEALPDTLDLSTLLGMGHGKNNDKKET